MWLPVQGFKRLADSLADLELDLPNARQDFECLRETAEMQGWLPDAGVAEDLPDCNASISLTDFKAAVNATLKEYQTAGDIGEVAKCLSDMHQQGFHSLIVTQVRLAG